MTPKAKHFNSRVDDAPRRIRIPIETDATASWLDDEGFNPHMRVDNAFTLILPTKDGSAVKRDDRLWDTQICGSSLDTIFWAYKVGLSEFKANFLASLKRCTLDELKNHRDTILRFDNYPRELYDYISAEILRLRTVARKAFKKMNTNVWFRIKVREFEVDEHGCPLEFPLGKYEEVYVESDKLNSLDEFMTYQFGINVFDLDIFQLTIMDGDSVFERRVNNSKAKYHVYNHQAVEGVLSAHAEWLNKVDEDENND